MYCRRNSFSGQIYFFFFQDTVAFPRIFDRKHSFFRRTIPTWPLPGGTLEASLQPGGRVVGRGMGSKLFGGVAPGFEPRTSCLRVRSVTITLQGPPQHI